jgi:outer membrane murein-binding lipoprotein Lpp
MKNQKQSFFSQIILMVLLLSGCAAPAPTPDVHGTATMASLHQTQAALNITVQAYQAAQTEAARATETPLPPTITPTPTVTPGPIIIQDDFSTDNGRWVDCGQCKIENGGLHMGPYPISNDGGGYIAICNDCGQPGNYKMGVDATFVDGYTDRGFGLVLREQNGSYLDVEITTWQYYGAWIFDNDKKQWGAFFTDGWKPTGSLNPSAQTNRLETELVSKDGKDTITIRINGDVVSTITSDTFSGRVGLVVGLHSLGVIFDNFYFETDD